MSIFRCRLIESERNQFGVGQPLKLSFLDVSPSLADLVKIKDDNE